MVDYMQKHLPLAATHKIYFDYGTVDLDREYEEYQKHADQIMQEKGYVKDINWKTLRFRDDGHNEFYWRRRVHIPLEFLLKK